MSIVPIAVVLLAIGCVEGAGPQSSAVAPSHSEDTSAYVLGADDQLRIWALGFEGLLDKPFRIDPSGDLDLPLAGTIRAAGLTVEQLKAQLVARFAREVLKPEVSVEIVDFGSQPVSVMGAVNQPGIHQLRGRRTVAEVLSLAGGLRHDAGDRITMSRQIQYGSIPLHTAKTDPSGKFSVAEVAVKSLMAAANPTENIQICPHDVVTVSTMEVIYVIGEVRKPGEVALKDRESLSVLQALSSAEGFGLAPAPQDSKIVRVVPGTKERKEIPVDLRKIMAGKAEDLAMRPNDILLVPPSRPKKAVARALEAAIQTATGIAIWRRN